MMNFPFSSQPFSRAPTNRGAVLVQRLALALFAVGLTLASVAHAALVDVGASDIGFLAVGPGGLKIEGTGSGISASETGGTLHLKAPLSSLETGISLRDKHMRKALNASKHPYAKLAVQRSKLQFPGDNQVKTASAQGEFTLNGVTRSLPFDYKVKRTGSDYHVQGKAQIDITDFKIEQPCYLGVCVDKNVKLKVSFKLREK